LPAPIPSPTDKPAIPAKITIEKAVKDFLAEHEGESANSTIRDYRYLLNDFKEASVSRPNPQKEYDVFNSIVLLIKRRGLPA
jgi:hypothetical protein